MLSWMSRAAGACAALMMLVPAVGSAAPITRQFDFTAPSLGLVGSFTASFDNSVPATNQTSLTINDLELNGVDFVLSNPLVYNYFSPALDTLEFTSGLFLGQNGISIAFTNASDLDTAAFFSVAITTVDTTGVQDTSVGTLAVSDPNAVATPEPATLAIIGLGLAGLTLARRRRALP